MRQNFRNAGFQEVYETIVTKSCGRIVYGISDRLMQEIPHECMRVPIVRWVPTNNFLIRIEISVFRFVTINVSIFLYYFILFIAN